MTRLDTAMKRLSGALDTLGTRMAEVRAAQDAAPPPEISETESHEAEELRSERDRLLARLTELEAESHTLAGVTGEVEARLEDAIAEIREVLARAA